MHAVIRMLIVRKSVAIYNEFNPCSGSSSIVRRHYILAYNSKASLLNSSHASINTKTILRLIHSLLIYKRSKEKR